MKDLTEGEPFAEAKMRLMHSMAGSIMSRLASCRSMMK